MAGRADHGYLFGIRFGKDLAIGTGLSSALQRLRPYQFDKIREIEGSSIRFFVKTVLLGTTVLLTGAASANFTGFCIPRASWIAETEILARATTRAFNSALAASRALDRDGIEVRRLDYVSLSDFEQRNPGCCSLRQEGPMGLTLSMWGKITGQALAFVWLDYLASGYSGPEVRHDSYVITNCGKLRNIIN